MIASVHDAVDDVRDPNVQLPAAPPDNVIVPWGADTVPAVVSLTVTVTWAVWPTVSDDDSTTAVLVLRVVGVTLTVDEPLPEKLASPE